MNYKVEFEHSVTNVYIVTANDESEAEDIAFDRFERDGIVGAMITKVTEVE